MEFYKSKLELEIYKNQYAYDFIEEVNRKLKKIAKRTEVTMTLLNKPNRKNTKSRSPNKKIEKSVEDKIISPKHKKSLATES